MEIWSKNREILTPQDDFFAIKYKFLKILADKTQNGIPFYREGTVIWFANVSGSIVCGLISGIFSARFIGFV